MTKVVFMGTPEFAVPALEQIIQHFEVLGVVTQPDRPAGRNPEPQPSPVKVLAEQHNLPVFQPEKLRQPDAIEHLKQWEDVDVYIVVAFGQILPQEVLDIPKHGAINVHASLLPRWRGAAPIQTAIRAGDRYTGVTIMKMDAGLDTGPILSQGSLEISKRETAATLHKRLAHIGAHLLVQTVIGYLEGSIKPQPQDEEGVTVAPQIKKEEGHIDWTKSAEEIERLVRAFTPWPGTYTYWGDQLLKILAGKYGDDQRGVKVGQVFHRGKRLGVQTGSGVFYPTQVQLAGKKPTSMEDFINGHAEVVGQILK